MKLAEALVLKEDYRQKIEELKYRLNDQLLVRVGDELHQETEELLERIEETMKKLHCLEQQIHETCINVKVDDVHTLNHFVQERNYIRKKYNFLRQTLMSITIRNPRFTKPEIRLVPTLSAEEIEAKEVAAKKRLNELEGMLQRINWEVELSI